MLGQGTVHSPPARLAALLAAPYHAAVGLDPTAAGPTA